MVSVHQYDVGMLLLDTNTHHTHSIILHKMLGHWFLLCLLDYLHLCVYRGVCIYVCVCVCACVCVGVELPVMSEAGHS